MEASRASGYTPSAPLARGAAPDPSPPRSELRQGRPCRAPCAPVCDRYAPGKGRQRQRKKNALLAPCGPRVAISRFNVNTASEQGKTPKREQLFWFDF